MLMCKWLLARGMMLQVWKKVSRPRLSKAIHER